MKMEMRLFQVQKSYFNEKKKSVVNFSGSVTETHNHETFWFGFSNHQEKVLNFDLIYDRFS